MKKLTFFLLFITHLCFSQIRNEQQVPDIHFGTLLNAPVREISLNELKGKVVILEFWATWCGPCLVAMPHLKEMQKKFGEKLQVITVTDERPERISKFLKSRPSNLWFAIDTARAVTKLFPHRMIPHTVVISAEGKLVAETTPDAITDQTIDSLLNGKEVHLPEKTDNPMSPPEAIMTYFNAADTVKNRFIMHGEIKGSPGVSTTHLNDSIFKGRRLTCFNLSLTTLYRIAYGNFAYKRTIDKTNQIQEAPVYSLDLIVNTPAELLPQLKQELDNRFDLRSRIEPQMKEVNVVKIADRKKFNLIPRNKSGKRTYTSSHGEINQDAITMTDFADFLEDYGTEKLLVIDETGNSEKLDIKFSFEPENPQSLKDKLNDMGLVLVKQKQKIDMLVLDNE